MPVKGKAVCRLERAVVRDRRKTLTAGEKRRMTSRKCRLKGQAGVARERAGAGAVVMWTRIIPALSVLLFDFKSSQKEAKVVPALLFRLPSVPWEQ